MENRILERRRLLQLVGVGALALPAVIVGGCAQAPNGQRRDPFGRSGGGNRGGEKSGGGGSGGRS